MIKNKDTVFGIRSIIEVIKSGKTIDKFLFKKAYIMKLLQYLEISESIG